MEKRGLIKQGNKNGNRRSLYVSRTEHGEQMTEVVEERHLHSWTSGQWKG